MAALSVLTAMARSEPWALREREVGVLAGLLAGQAAGKPEEELKAQAWAAGARWQVTGRRAVRKELAGATPANLTIVDDDEDDTPPPPPRPLYYRFDRGGRQVGVVHVFGPLMRADEDVKDSKGNYFGTAAEWLEMAFAAVKNDAVVGGVVLLVTTPGGQASICEELLGQVRALDAAKPVCAYVRDQCCSAGLYMAVGARRITINPGGEIGCIGCVCVHEDWSGNLAEHGVKLTEVVSNPNKLGAPYWRPLDERGQAALQREVDHYGLEFDAALVASRKITAERLAEWKAHPVYIGAEAVRVGMADAVESFEQALDWAAAAGAASAPAAVTKKTRRDQPMSATVNELKAAFPSESDFVLACLSDQVTLDEAKSRFAGLQAERNRAELAKAKAENEDLAKRLAEMEAKATARAAEEAKAAAAAAAGGGGGGRGVPPVKTAAGGGAGTGGGAGADEGSPFMALVEEEREKAADKGERVLGRVILNRAMERAKAAERGGDNAAMKDFRRLQKTGTLNGLVYREALVNAE